MKRYTSIWPWLQSEFKNKTSLNYCYFGFFLLFLNILSFFHFLYKENALLGIRLFFLLYALGQALLEVFGFVLIGYLFNRFFPRWLYYLFIGSSFLILLLHFADFTLIQLMDTSIRYVFKCLFGCGVNHFLATIQSIHLNATMACLMGISFLCIPLLGIVFYQMTDRWTRRHPWKQSLAQLLQTLIGLALFLLFLDCIACPIVHRSTYDQYAKALPLGTVFLPPTPQQIILAQCPTLFPNIDMPLEEVAMIEPRPNIYIWIIESLRRDFIHEEVAPHLTSFGQRYGTFDASFANANATHLSWFAIFHALFPYHWTGIRDHAQSGSLPLQILKQLGYKIKAYSAADLHYYEMDQILFGDHHQLLDELQDFSSNWNLEPYQRDRAVLDTLLRDLEQESSQGGQVYLLFLDATHSEYSFPQEEPLKFTPIAKEIDYLTIIHTKKNLESIKNRYRNAIHYVDQLLGEFLARLENRSLLEEAILVITGDHGEEFFEEGALFHATHLNTMQTSVPLFCKCPTQTFSPHQIACHIDIFPTILHTLLGDEMHSYPFDGHSLSKPSLHPHHLTVMQNGATTPIEFTLQQDEIRMQVRFVNPSNIYGEPTIEVLSMQSQGEELLYQESLDSLVKRYCPDIFHPILFHRTP